MRRTVLLALVRSLAGLTASAFGSPLARAADPTQGVARLAFVGAGTPFTAPHGVAAFWGRLRELGWVKNQNLLVEERWAEGQFDRLPALMAEVVALKVDVIVTYNTPSAIAAKHATSTIPIVSALMADPIKSGLAASLAHPGENLTGFSMAWAEGVQGKYLELLHDTVPRLSTVAVILHPANPAQVDAVKYLKNIAPMRRLKVIAVEVTERESLESAFEQARKQAQAAILLPSPMLLANRQLVAALAVSQRLPVMYELRDFVDAGGLMAYTPDPNVMFRRAAEYADKILRGARPGDLPIEQPTQYELVVNLKAAKALGITIPESILLRANEVIK